MTASISDDVRAIEEALAAGPARDSYPTSIGGTLDYARDLRAWSDEMREAANPARLRRVLDTMQAMGEALRLYGASCDATESDPCGYEGSLCCMAARNALALYEGKQ